MDTRMITALYERLSRDDDLEGESNSISNQKRQLEDYARSQGFPNPVHFTDDGISGTCFDRPGFLAMMKEVEAGRVEYLLIKDMSRLGRDYLKVGQIMEILRQKGVRLIAINDGVDSARGDDDFTPFRNIMNEYYARDTSRKIRSTFQSKGKSGKHVTGTVIYGYLWNETRDQWLVDEYSAGIVKRIFAMTIEGMGPYQIASRLKEEKVLIPSAYLATHNEGVNKNKTFKDVYGWGSSTIVNILDKREYLGHTVNFKTRKHFKDKKSHYVPEDEWTIFEDTHEAIIDQETFDLAQKVRSKVRRYPDGWGEVAPLTGLMYCADCGGKMYSKKGFPTKKEATQHEAEMKAKLHNPGQIASIASQRKQTVASYLNEWVESYARVNLRPSTYDGYKRTIANYITPYIGGVALNQLTPAMVDKMFQQIIDKGLKPSTAAGAKRVLSVALSHARKYRYIETNAAKDTLTKFGKSDKTPDPYTPEQVKALMQRVEGTVWEMPVILGGLYGMRRSEILGLRWRNVDLENNTFDVSEQLPFKVPPKTKVIEEMAPPKSNGRKLPITELARPFFLKQFAMQEAQREQAEKDGKPYYDNDLVVAKPDGSPISASWVSSQFGKLLEDLDMPHIRFHDLRHTAATNMHQLTGDFYTVGEVLGHTLAGIGVSLGLSMNFEAVTARYVDVRLERKKEVLDAYHGAVKQADPAKAEKAEPKKAKSAAKKKSSDLEL